MSDAGQATAGLGAGEVFARVRRALQRGDIALAIGIITVLVVLILPLPRFLLDFSLALSITFSVLILLTSLFIQKPLEFSAFPTVLLISTMLRLALNLASTRLILSHGHEGTGAAGHVIEAFGRFVMGGNFVIGVIVFVILVIVNFVVITKGSGRIAEVAARFSLDAMPGKQMAVDADLSAGLIDEGEARRRRSELEQESNFFGAMDGAAKFVRGDAVAGLLITFINVVGGIVIGVAQMGLSFGDAAHSYTLLTIGDGLVSQIPALIVSTAAGLLVSKAGVTGSADKALFGQLSGYPQALGLASALMVIMSLLPGIPMLPFLSLGAGAGALAWRVVRARDGVKADVAQREREARAAPPPEEPIHAALALDSLRLELGYGLLPLINDAAGYRLTDQIKALRRQVAGDLGFVMPSVRILDNMQLNSTGYVIRVKEVEAGRGELRLGQLLAIDPRGEPISLPGTQTTEPAFGLPATWIDESLREEAAFRGYTVVDPATVITTQLTEVVKANMADLLSYAEVQKLLDDLPREHQRLVSDLIPSQVALSLLQRVLQTLLGERVSIRDLPAILEAVGEAVRFTQNAVLITEHVRSRLGRQICNANLGGKGYLALLPLSPQWEQAFADALTGHGEERQLSMAPSRLQDFINGVRTRFEQAGHAGEAPVLLTSPGIRPYVRSIVERFRAQTVVMSQTEIHPQVKIRTVGQIDGI